MKFNEGPADAVIISVSVLAIQKAAHSKSCITIVNSI